MSNYSQLNMKQQNSALDQMAEIEEVTREEMDTLMEEDAIPDEYYIFNVIGDNDVRVESKKNPLVEIYWPNK